MSNIASIPPSAFPPWCFLIPRRCWQGSIIAAFLPDAAPSHQYQKMQNLLVLFCRMGKLTRLFWLMCPKNLVALFHSYIYPSNVVGALTIPPLLSSPVNDETRLSLVSYPIPTLPLLTKSKKMNNTISRDPPLMVCFPPLVLTRLLSRVSFLPKPKTSCCVITIFNKCTISVVSWSCVYVIKHKNTVVYFSLTSLPLGYISDSTNSLHQKSTISSFNTGWCVQSRHSGQRGQERRRPR